MILGGWARINFGFSFGRVCGCWLLQFLCDCIIIIGLDLMEVGRRRCFQWWGMMW